MPIGIFMNVDQGTDTGGAVKYDSCVCSMGRPKASNMEVEWGGGGLSEQICRDGGVCAVCSGRYWAFLSYIINNSCHI